MALDATIALVTVDELRLYLSGDSLTIGELDASSYQAPMENLINGVSQWFASATGRTLVAQEVTEYHDGDNTDKLYLRSWPVVDGSAVFYVDSEHDFGAETEVTVDHIVEDECYYSGGFPDGYQNIKVVATVGYETIPNDIKLSCLLMCQTMWDKQQKGTSGVAQINLSGTSLQLHAEEIAPPYVLDVVDRYRRRYA